MNCFRREDRTKRERVLGWCVALMATCFLAVNGASRARAEELAPHHDLTYYVDREGTRQIITDFDSWEFRRRAILKAVQEVMGALPGDARRAPLEMQVEEEVTLEGGLKRLKITYQSEPGSRVPAILFLPPVDAGKRLPAVLCLHQTTQHGKGESAGLVPNDKSYALDLARRGFVTIAPDYPGFGEHQWDFSPDRGYSSGSMKAIWDNLRAVDLLESLPQVDGERIGGIGHSLGGHNVIFTALFDPRIKAIATSCGFTRLDRDDLPSWTGRTYMPRIASVYANDIKKLPFDFPELIAALAPRPLLTCSAVGDTDFDVQGVKDCLAFAKPIYELYGAADRLSGFYPAGPHGFPPESRRASFEFLEKHLRGSLLVDWPAKLPEKNGVVLLPAQSWPQHPGQRRVRVLVHYPGGKLANVNEQTGVMLSLHNWGGTDCVGTANPLALAERLNVIALCVNYLQSGAQASVKDPEPYDFGYLQALDALRAVFFARHALAQEGIKFSPGRLFATGGSGGGNVTLMAGKLAPRSFAALVDICGMSRLTDDMAFGLPGGTDLDARFSRDPLSPNYLLPGRQDLHFVGHPEHLKTMKRLGSSHHLFVAHGVEDAACPVADAQEMVANLQAAELPVTAHFVTKDDLDGKAFLSPGHSVGNRTEIVFKVAGPRLGPGGDDSLVRKEPSDFDLRDEAVCYRVQGGVFIISYAAGYPVGRFEALSD